MVAKAGALKVPLNVAFQHAPGATALSTGSNTFLRQPGTRFGDCQDVIDVTAVVHRAHNTYVTIGLPGTAPPSNEMYDQAVLALLDVLNVLLSIDASLLLYVFPIKACNNPQARPLRPRSWRDQPLDKPTLEIYAHQVRLQAGNRPFLHFLLGHEKLGDEMFCSQLQERLDAQDSSFQVDLIQAVIVTCGFLVGSYMQSFNIDHYNALLSMIPKFATCLVSIIKRNVQLLAGEKNGPRIPAAHVQCDATECKTTVKLHKA